MCLVGCQAGVAQGTSWQQLLKPAMLLQHLRLGKAAAAAAAAAAVVATLLPQWVSTLQLMLSCSVAGPEVANSLGMHD
jgi:hypothetical protein